MKREGALAYTLMRPKGGRRLGKILTAPKIACDDYEVNDLHKKLAFLIRFITLGSDLNSNPVKNPKAKFFDVHFL